MKAKVVKGMMVLTIRDDGLILSMYPKDTLLPIVLHMY
jgi:hypothetical protein